MASAEGEGDKKIITLKSNDDVEFKVEEVAAMQSNTVTYLIEDCTDSIIPLPNVNSKILSKVIEYCNKHASAAKPADTFAATFAADASSGGEDLKTWDKEFVKMDQTTLFDLILAANYMHIQGLFDLTCQTVADMMIDKSPEEIRKMFNIENDLTPEEEEEVRKENAWAFD